MAGVVLLFDGELEKAYNEAEKNVLRNDFFDLDPQIPLIYSFPRPGPVFKLKDITMLLNDVRKDFEPFRKLWITAFSMY